MTSSDVQGYTAILKRISPNKRGRSNLLILEKDDIGEPNSENKSSPILGTPFPNSASYTFHAWDTSGSESDPESVSVSRFDCQGAQGGRPVVHAFVLGDLGWLIYRIYFLSVLGSSRTCTHNTDYRQTYTRLSKT